MTVTKEKTIKKTAKRDAVVKAVRKTSKPAAKKIETEADEQVLASKVKKEKYYEAVGRRKSAIARVRLFTQGDKTFTVNDRPVENYFPTLELWQSATSSLRKMKSLDRFRIVVKVHGGGIRGQAEAIRLGAARTLVLFNADYGKRLRKAGYLTRDARVKERKKFGLKKARRAPQWAKR